MGSRMLARWILAPLIATEAIAAAPRCGGCVRRRARGARSDARGSARAPSTSSASRRRCVFGARRRAISARCGGRWKRYVRCARRRRRRSPAAPKHRRVRAAAASDLRTNAGRRPAGAARRRRHHTSRSRRRAWRNVSRCGPTRARNLPSSKRANASAPASRRSKSSTRAPSATRSK